MDQTRLLEKIIASLRQEKHRHDSFDEPGHAYRIETRIEISDREWSFISSATYNGVEITDAPELIKETSRRKRVAQVNKTKALWNLFVKEAATIHFERCNAARRRLKKSGKRQMAVNSKTTMALMMVVLAGFALFMLYPTPQSTPPIAPYPDMDESPPPLTPVVLTLEEPEPVPSFEFKDRVSGAGETIPSPVTVARTIDEADSASPPAVPAGSSDELNTAPRSAVIDRLPEGSQPQAEALQHAGDLSPEDIKERIRSILENKTESP